ncbi:MAG: zinc ribbon domain-containing protein [Burkholderiales bacterium]|nr:zinc ribbon domain-containing protein [Burkholderiales bacterium]
MPIYAYRCAACGHSRDVLQKLSDAPLTVCPACGAEQFAKQLTAAGFQLKGSGWYATDFRNSGGSGASTGKPAAGAAEGGGSSASSGGDSAAAAASTPCGGSCACH